MLDKWTEEIKKVCREMSEAMGSIEKACHESSVALGKDLEDLEEYERLYRSMLEIVEDRIGWLRLSDSWLEDAEHSASCMEEAERQLKVCGTKSQRVELNMIAETAKSFAKKMKRLSDEASKLAKEAGRIADEAWDEEDEERRKTEKEKSRLQADEKAV